MAKKADLLEKAQAMDLAVTQKNTIAEIEAAIAEAEAASANAPEVEKAPAQEETQEEEEAKVAKAGKRSAKALREAEEEKSKGSSDEEDSRQTKGPAPVTRPLIERRSKAYRKAAEKLEDKEYELKDAMQLATETSTVKFDATVELHVKLGVNPRHSDQNIRESVTLPHGTGKTVKVAVFAPADMHEEAKKAGADIVGEDKIIEQLKNEEIDFDVLISIPQFMPQLGKFAKFLGPKGLMPNPKSGTVTKDIAKAVEQAKAGRVEFRVDSYGIVHLGIGKVSFGADKLTENAQTVLDVIKAAKPQNLKAIYLQGIHVTTTMGPSIKVAV